MSKSMRLLMAMLASEILSSLLLLALFAWQNPGRFLESVQQGWKFGGLLFVSPAVANTAVGFAVSRSRTWALLPLAFVIPAVAVVTEANNPKGPFVIGLSLVPAGIA